MYPLSSHVCSHPLFVCFIRLLLGICNFRLFISDQLECVTELNLGVFDIFDLFVGNLDLNQPGLRVLPYFVCVLSPSGFCTLSSACSSVPLDCVFGYNKSSKCSSVPLDCVFVAVYGYC